MNIQNKIFVGKRKCSVARIEITSNPESKGVIIVNKKSVDEYIKHKHLILKIMEPLELAKLTGAYNIKVKVYGGGITGQADAIRLGIARGIIDAFPNLRKIFKKYKCLTRDSRIKERKKYGLKKARKAPQFSKR